VVEYARVAAGETLLVIGANGGVGEAVAQIGKWRGARVIGSIGSSSGLRRRVGPPLMSSMFCKTSRWNLWSAMPRTVTAPKSFSILWEGPCSSPLKSLGHRGRLLEIASAGDRGVSFDLRDFYHNESQLFGVDTRARDAIGSSALLEALTPFFEQGTFQPPAIDRTFPLTDGIKAYQEVDRGEVRGWLVLTP
jgi:NADPH:quinone reductase